jgi:hypothetical protein
MALPLETDFSHQIQLSIKMLGLENVVDTISDAEKLLPSTFTRVA